MALPLSSPTAATTGVLHAAVAGLGVGLPDEVVTNDDWAALLDTSDEWITSRTGIRERRRVDADEATSDLAVRAAVSALADAGVAPSAIDAVVLATTTPDHVVPQTAPTVADALGLRCSAFDVGAGCSGFVYGLAVVASMVSAGLAGRVLLIGAETMTRVVDAGDRTTAVLFGDGAGAFVVDGSSAAIGPFDLGSDGALAPVLMIPAGGTRRPADADTVEEGAHTLRMNGREVYRQAVTSMTASSQVVLEAAGVGIADVDLFVGHQANARILDAVASRLGIDDDQAHVAVDRFGNTSAASIPIALADARDAGRLHAGDRVLLTAFGAGLTWGSCLLEWCEAER